jgi:glutathione S-transferase
MGENFAMYHFTALVTCLAVLFYIFASTRVSRARRAYGVKLPATSGHADFERVFRVHMNTLEWMPIFLPSLWLFAIYVSDADAAALGLIWIVGRIRSARPDLDRRPYPLHDRLHARRRKTRAGLCHPGIGVRVLLFGALVTIVWRIVHA